MKKRSLDFVALLLLPLFNLAQSNYGDLKSAQFLCDKSPLSIESLPDGGLNVQEISLFDCFPSASVESNSHWLKWTAANNGTLAFSIVPLQADDDIDFVLLRLDSENSHSVLRCMASGRRLGENIPNDAACTGVTGLAFMADPTESMSNGCPEGASAFLQAVTLEAGKNYALLIHNHRSSRGLQVEFDGTVSFVPLGTSCAVLPNIDVAGLDNGKASFSQVYPDPASNHIGIDIDLPQSGDGFYQIIDARGSLLRHQALRLSGGAQHVDIPTESLASGVFFLKIHVGDALHLARFVKK